MRIAQELSIVRGACLRELSVEVAPTECRRALNEEEILRGKEHHREKTYKLTLTQRLSRTQNTPPVPTLKCK